MGFWQVVFVPALVLLEFGVLAVLIIVLTSYIQSARAGAPFVPVSGGIVRQLLLFAGVGKGDVVYDLGCGDGRILRAAVTCGARRAVGYEISFVPYLSSLFRTRQLRRAGSVRVVRGDARRADVSDATVVYLYLMPKLLDAVVSATKRAMARGTRILACGFPLDVQRHPELRLLRSEKIGRITAYLYEKVASIK